MSSNLSEETCLQDPTNLMLVSQIRTDRSSMPHCPSNAAALADTVLHDGTLLQEEEAASYQQQFPDHGAAFADIAAADEHHPMDEGPDQQSDGAQATAASDAVAGSAAAQQLLKGPLLHDLVAMHSRSAADCTGFVAQKASSSGHQFQRVAVARNSRADCFGSAHSELLWPLWPGPQHAPAQPSLP